MVRFRSGHKTATEARLLCLIRHGKAAPKDVGLEDFERALTEKGTAECIRVAQAMAKKKLKFDLMISSPADRALDSAHIFAEILQYPALKIQIAHQLYSDHSAVKVVRSLSSLFGHFGHIALFGHNPLLNEMATLLLGAFDREILKGAAVGISFEGNSWSGLQSQKGSLEFYLPPTIPAARARAPI